MPRPEKDPTIAVILAILSGLFGFMGIGHLYVGKIARGVVLLLVGLFFIPLIIFFSFVSFVAVSPRPGVGFGFAIIALIFVAVVGWLVLLIWQTLDANRLAHEYNQRVATTGVPPW